MTYSLAVCARTACVDVLAVREVALCVKYGHFGAQTLRRNRLVLIAVFASVALHPDRRRSA